MNNSTKMRSDNIHHFNTWMNRIMFTLLILGSFVLLHIVPFSSWAETPLGDEAINTLYKQGQYNKVIDKLGNFKDWSAEESLYLGLSYLKIGKSQGAIGAWKHYVRLEKGSEVGRKISKYLSVLLQQEGKRWAKARVKEEKRLSKETDPKAIAVLPFKNLGATSYAPLSKGLAAMIITDLSEVEGLVVVERIQLQAILNEMKLAESNLVDQKNAPRLGRLVGAGRVTTGSLHDFDNESMRIDASITRTESGKVMSSAKAEGQITSFYKIEKALVFKILCGIGRCPESLDRRTRTKVEKVHTKNFKAFQHYSKGLDLFDRGKYKEASKAFFLAIEEDPRFGLARRGLLETPIVPLTQSAMVAGGEKAATAEAAISNFKAEAVLAAVKPVSAEPLSSEPASTVPVASEPTSTEPAPSTVINQVSSVPFVPIPLPTQQPVNNGAGATAEVIVVIEVPQSLAPPP